MAEQLDIFGRIWDRRSIVLLAPDDRPLRREVIFVYDPSSRSWESSRPEGAARRSANARWHRRRLRVTGRDLQRGTLELESFVMNGLSTISHWAELLPSGSFSATDNEPPLDR